MIICIGYFSLRPSPEDLIVSSMPFRWRKYASSFCLSPNAPYAKTIMLSTVGLKGSTFIASLQMDITSRISSSVTASGASPMSDSYSMSTARFVASGL